MARRIELRGVVNALNESFVSRNNDCKGFWAIGQLKLLAINNNLTAMDFFLIPSKNSQNFNLGSYIELHYKDMLRHLLSKQKIPDNWVSEASIRIEFNVNAKHEELYNCLTSGAPFQCCCQMTDDIGRIYASVIYSRCQAHSSVKELKSTR